MSLIKIIIRLFFLCLLNGCAQHAVLFGPAITVAGTGSVYQAGLSYASNQVVIKITGKTPAENVKIFLENNENDNSGNANNFFEMVKKINTNSSVKTLANQ